MNNITYHPTPAMYWNPAIRASDHATLCRLIDQWIADGRRSVIGPWSLDLWSFPDARGFVWITVTDMACKPPNHEPRTFDLVPACFFPRRKTNIYCGVSSYVNTLRLLERDTWYETEFATDPTTWLIEERWIEETETWLAVVIEYGNGQVRGFAASGPGERPESLAMAAIDNALGTRDGLADLLVVPDNVNLSQRSVSRAFGPTTVVRLDRFHAPGTVATVNLGIRRLVSCGREFLLDTTQPRPRACRYRLPSVP